MNTANKALIAVLSIATLAVGVNSAQAAPQQAEVSTLPTITIIGKRPVHADLLATVTVVGKRLTAQEKLALAQQDDCLPTVTVIGKRLNHEPKVMAQQEGNHKKAVI